MKKILLIEDDSSLGPTLSKTLEQEGYQVELATNLAKAREHQYQTYDLILLDWMLPDEQGVDLLREIKSQAPVIMLTARTDLIDKVLGLESGANDYITKPFEPRELIARIRVQLRNTKGHPHKDSEGEILEIGQIKFNLIEHKLFYQGHEVSMTKMEFNMLYLLAKNPNRVYSREKLLDEVWGYENYPTTRTVDTHVLQIRQKISNEVIETVRGVGYRFNPNHT